MAIKQIYLGDGRYGGYINTNGSMIYAYNNTGEQVGYYNKNTKQTFDKAGRLVQNGGIELLGALIMTNYKK